MKTLITIGAIIILVLAGTVGYLLHQEINITEQPNLGGLGPFNATTTITTFNTTNQGGALLKTGHGIFGTLTVVAAPTVSGAFDLYNATTTNVNARTGNKATSTILITSFSSANTAGNYIYNIGFTDGLLMDYKGTAGTMGTTTLTWD